MAQRNTRQRTAVGELLERTSEFRTASQIHDDLRHFKQVMEIGEIVLSDATKQRGMHPAQPDDKPIEL